MGLLLAASRFGFGRGSLGPRSEDLSPGAIQDRHGFSQGWPPTIEGFVDVRDIFCGVTQHQIDHHGMNLVLHETGTFLHGAACVSS